MQENLMTVSYISNKYRLILETKVKTIFYV